MKSKKPTKNEKNINSQRLKVAIFDLTDCEGCELVLINLREKLALLNEQTDIANWRFAFDNHNLGPFDVSFIEGSPTAEKDIEITKQARAVSKYVVTLGSCAELGGIQATLNNNEWEEGIKEVYGNSYKTKNKAPKPVSYYIDVDYHLPGCPINQNELAQLITSIISEKKPTEYRSPVCLECKARENTCLFLEGEPCLGPITKGGCEAVCPSRGLRCWGCFGPLSGGNHKALKRNFEKQFGKDKTKELLKTFFSQTNEFKELYPKEK
ncbi:MAG: hypothetical protein WC437_02190 [Patescibacteria group bacterium]|jgi:coenzyme F420-reducing hydrogenase gamma subunit|nr:hypothetical protein [Patescibacteria group bacterium]